MLLNWAIEKVKVQRKHFGPDEATWEMVDLMWDTYPCLSIEVKQLWYGGLVISYGGLMISYGGLIVYYGGLVVYLWWFSICFMVIDIFLWWLIHAICFDIWFLMFWYVLYDVSICLIYILVYDLAYVLIYIIFMKLLNIHPCMDVNIVTICVIKLHYVVWMSCHYDYVVMLLRYHVVVSSWSHMDWHLAGWSL